jgi:YHS domain-containing protein
MRIHSYVYLGALVLAAAVTMVTADASTKPLKRLINVDDTGLALRGYDPVSYFADGKAVMGKPDIVSSYNGGRYQFVSVEHKATFEAMPAKYEPQFGGYCGYAVANNDLAPIDPDAFTIINDRLVLQKAKWVLRLWNVAPQKHLNNADKNWPGLVDSRGK